MVMRLLNTTYSKKLSIQEYLDVVGKDSKKIREYTVNIVKMDLPKCQKKFLNISQKKML